VRVTAPWPPGRAASTAQLHFARCGSAYRRRHERGDRPVRLRAILSAWPEKGGEYRLSAYLATRGMLPGSVPDTKAPAW